MIQRRGDLQASGLWQPGSEKRPGERGECKESTGE